MLCLPRAVKPSCLFSSNIAAQTDMEHWANAEHCNVQGEVTDANVILQVSGLKSSTSGSLAAFERMEQKVVAMEAEAEAVGQVGDAYISFCASLCTFLYSVATPFPCTGHKRSNVMYTPATYQLWAACSLGKNQNYRSSKESCDRCIHSSYLKMLLLLCEPNCHVPHFCSHGCYAVMCTCNASHYSLLL